MPSSDSPVSPPLERRGSPADAAAAIGSDGVNAQQTDAEIPVSTYRVQFHKGFRFADCHEIVSYLHEIGIGALYSSPRFRARRGSSHGYDVASSNRVNSELGTDEEFDELCEKLNHYRLGLVLDIVPNHMTASQENPWWMDVLENGPSAQFAHYFDIEWHPVTSKATFLQENKVTLPVLGNYYGNVLENRELSVRIDERGLFVRYFDRTLPIDPKTYGPVLDFCAERLSERLGPAHPSVETLESVRRMLDEMPERTSTEPGAQFNRRTLAGSAKERLFAAYRDHQETRLTMDTALDEFSGSSGCTHSFDRLHALLDAQAYRLAFWKIGNEEINYRRFFDVNDLVCLRVEEEDVFTSRHQATFDLITERKVTGLRVDHIDGLHDPQGYLARLGLSTADAGQPGTYILVEKILGRDETLPERWRAHGTTGYDYLNALNSIFMEPSGLALLQSSYQRYTGQDTPFAEVCYSRNKQVMWKLFAGEIHSLGHELGALAAQHRQARDVPLSELVEVLVEVTACLPVYRTYVREFDISPRDRAYLERTLDLARRRTSPINLSDAAFHFMRSVLLLEPTDYAPELKERYLGFVTRWQQFTGPVMAKGLEDTACYVDNSFLSRNEVGNDPLREKPPMDLDEFHRFNQLRLERWPHTMNATSTHDTKRSEDVRARLNVLTEVAGEWDRRLMRWSRMNRALKTSVHSIAVPTPEEEVLIYQTLLGAWPLDPDEEPGFHERTRAFLLKAIREAKVHSGWIRPDEEHEAAVLKFLDGLFDHSESRGFFLDFQRFQSKLAWHGALNSLSQVLLKITSPGVPDFYQGTELWDFSLVDPDNRRPVDFHRRVEALEGLRRRRGERTPGLLRELVSSWRDGRIKLYLTDKALDFRRVNAALFRRGEYLPLTAAGAHARQVIVFARHLGSSWCITVAPRWTTRLGPTRSGVIRRSAWRDTSLQLTEDMPSVWKNVLTGETVEARRSEDGTFDLDLGTLLRSFPVALLDAHSAVVMKKVDQ